MRFDGFISYSHAADGRLAPAVQRGLHRLAKPWHRRRALWIFRDQTGLAVTPGLWSSIQAALDGSQYFVLLASPEAAGSPWVNKEIEHWVATKSPEQILPVLTGGEWRWDAAVGDFTADSTAVPAAVRGVFAEEPLYLDLRWARDDLHLSLQHARFRDAIAQLAAPMHGVNKDELEGEDVRQHRRARRLGLAATASLVVLTLVATLTGVVAMRNADRANTAAGQARHEQQVAAEQRGSAQRATQEARQQKENARVQQQLTQTAAAETRRQEKLARSRQGLAQRAAADAARQQGNARRQQQLARRAGVLAREQEAVAKEQAELAVQARKETGRQKKIAEQQQRLARQAAAQARRQKQNALEQQRLAEGAAEEARRQERAAREQQRLAEQAAEEARRQKENADQQQRIAIGRRLMNEAGKATVDAPQTSLMLGLAASKVQRDAESRRSLTGLLGSTHYAGAITGVRKATYGPGGVLASIGVDNKTSLWDVSDQANPVSLSTFGDAGSVRGVLMFSPDGRTLLGPGRPDTLTLWDVTNRSHPAQLATIAGRSALGFSPDGHTLVVGDVDADGQEATSLWDVTDRTRPGKLSTLSQYYDFLADDVTFSPDGRTLVTAYRRQGIVWDVTDRAHPTIIGEELNADGGITEVEFSPQSDLLVAVDADGAIKFWSMQHPDEPYSLGPLPGHAGPVDSLAFSSDGRILVSGDQHGVFNVWQMTDVYADRIGGLTMRRALRSVALSPDGRTLVTTDGSTTATLWNVAANGAPQPLADLTRQRGGFLTAAFARDGRSMATADSYDGAVLWNTTDPARPTRRATLFANPTPDRRQFASMAFSPDLRTVATADTEWNVTLWDLGNPDRPVSLSKWEEETGPLDTMAFSPDGKLLAVETWDVSDTKVVLWDVGDRSHPARLARLADVQGPMAFSPDGRTLAVTGADTEADMQADNSVTLWDLTTKSTPVRLPGLTGHQNEVETLAFSPDGETVATASADGTAMLWDVTDRTRPRRRTVLTENETVTSVAFSPDGHILATASDDRTASFWEITDPAHVVRVSSMSIKMPYADINNSVVFSPDGRTVAVGNDSGRLGANVMLWDYTQLSVLRADPVERACAITGRGLTDDEWARYIPELPYEKTCPA